MLKSTGARQVGNCHVEACRFVFRSHSTQGIAQLEIVVAKDQPDAQIVRFLRSCRGGEATAAEIGTVGDVGQQSRRFA